MKRRNRKCHVVRVTPKKKKTLQLMLSEEWLQKNDCSEAAQCVQGN